MIYDKCYWCVWRGISGRYEDIEYQKLDIMQVQCWCWYTRGGWHAACNGTVSGPAVHHSAKPEKVGHSSSSKSFVWKYRSELELCIAAIIIFISSFSKTNEILNFSLLQVIFLHYTSFRYYINIIYYLPNQHNFRFVNIETAETDGFLGNWIDEIKRNQLFTFRKKSIKIVDNVLFKINH